MEQIVTVGRRKAAVARVYLRELSKDQTEGKITVNDRDHKVYFPAETLQYVVEQPFKVLGIGFQYNVVANICGGGVKGQAEALRLGISKALCELNPENRTVLKKEGFLTRDPRVVERKKYGRPKARKRFQFSKR
ncbi:MAG TPA: 30S ribosomal protein S9 [Salinivirgaceae bacterium]|nr:30S ribosomal protein S9 [Salinivirgaceae bacterium]